MSNASPDKFSSKIKSFCDMVDQAVKDYNFNCEKINELDRLTQDYLHILELGDLKYKERAALATKIQKARVDRRKYKDSCDILQPLMDFLNSDKSKNFLNLLRQAQGLTGKTENRLSAARQYIPRVISMTEFDKSTGRRNGVEIKDTNKA